MKLPQTFSTKATRYCLLTVLTVVLTACGAFTINDANKFRKGMSSTEVEQLSSRGPKEVFNFSIPSASPGKFSAQVYSIAFGDVKSTYMVIFRDDKLLYWGYPYEFSRHPDPLINEVGKAALTKYESL